MDKMMLERHDTMSQFSLGYPEDMSNLAECLTARMNCSVVGVSNIGKSALFRAIHYHAKSDWPDAVFVYVDCNRMLDMSDQGFYELILRCMMDELRHHPDLHPLIEGLEAAYQRVISPNSDFQVSLAFNEGITGLVEKMEHTLVLLLDEFDEPLRDMDGRVLLNLRALKDRYPQGLSYAVATNRPMREIRRDPQVDEFCEAFVHHVFYLSPLPEAETRRYALSLAEREHATFDDEDIQFIAKKSGGHPGLVEAICRILGEVTGPALRDASQDWIIHREVAERLRADSAVQTECLKLWNDLTSEEQEGLLTLLSPREAPPAKVLRSLKAKHVLREADGETEIFAQAFEDFVRRQRVVRRGTRRGIRLDADSGEVWVDGAPAPSLTRLEHRLMMLLYGHLGQICDKYKVVEAVWGEDYIEEVDDSRIEKLASRLRQKIEPDPSNPRYLITVRGRGYKLVDE